MPWRAGVGSKIMRAMGWSEAQPALGAARQGRSEPLQPTQRPRNLGLGADS